MKGLIFILIVAPALLLAGPKALAAQTSAFSFTMGDQTFSVDAATLDSWKGRQMLQPSQILNQAPPSLGESLLNWAGQAKQKYPYPQTFGYLIGPVYDYVETLANKLDVPVVEPSLKIEDGKVLEFTPPQDGLKIDGYKTTFEALQALEQNNNSVEIAVDDTQAKGSLAGTNDLGINQLIAHGVSGFSGSPNNRRHNIAVGLEKFKGLIIPQGAEFSFDDNLGPVTAEEGFLPELVIKGSEGTIPELGGGLCQVSTTTFRAAMAAGLPITARRNHAYAVQYYSPQGTDATIYPGSADLKFINDTPGAILIWPYEKDKNTLVFDFYGSNDGRQVTLEKPVVYDRTADGAMKATWTRLITKDGQTSTSTFKSIYQPPALFHKTESFVSATGAAVPTAPTPLKIQ